MATINVGGATKFAEAVSINPASVTNNAAVVQTFTVLGLDPNNVVLVSAPSMNTGMYVISSFCATKDTLSLVLWNNTGSPIDDSAQTIYVVQP